MTNLAKHSPLFHPAKISWVVLLMFAAFTLRATAPIDMERASELKVTAIGARLAGDTLIPAFSVDVRTGLDLSPEDRVLTELPILPGNLSAKSLSWLHLTGYGWLVIPRGWRVVDGGVGADGSMVLIAQSQSAQSWLEYRDAGNCVGCAISAANCFYPQAHAQAIENEFEFEACDQGVANTGKRRMPALQYQLLEAKDGSMQTLRNYIDSDGIRYQQLRLYQTDAVRPGSAEYKQLDRDPLALFFKRIWIGSE